ncbi:GAF domain-containing protein [Paenactinomyces guangxiensis]|uniref:GAF domain-containing protein n=1 Tax=Paenactinomyces guangxiensis TaxID=1490290 RepID=A0A7W2A784_9BACL|nr:GAF domain-containing protein [Paenactinomyces guangxiensis]MBA4492872.1 GAF domain-containing protein [Paenactinomyces guangxiensis]MBH8590280.1 GAF domain-containing protein [Paenactinomyces guangxiensis]
MFVFERVEGDQATRYVNILKQLEHLLEGEKDWLANLANTASHLYHSLDQVNWAGFYLLKEGELVLGPFMGQPACVRIAVGRGVCGAAVAEDETQRVEDVHQFPGHIACDASTRSEIVIPLRVDGKIIGVLDIDSPVKKRFDTLDQKYLEEYANILLRNTDWTPLLGK